MPANRLAEDDKATLREAPQAPSVLSSWPRAIVQALDARGVDGRAIAARAGLGEDELARPGSRTSIEVTEKLWRSAVAETGDVAFGLFASRFLTFPTFQALGIAILASATIRDAFARLVRYSRIVSDAVDYRLEDGGDRYRLVVNVAPAARLEHEAVDAVVSLTVRAIRTLRFDRNAGPLAVELQRPEPSPSTAYRRFFRAPVVFLAPQNDFEFWRELIEAPLAGGQAELALHSDEHMSRELARLEAGSLADRVRAYVLEHLVEGEPAQAAAATALGLGARTLQRRLAEEGQSFAGIVATTRRDLAMIYLRERGWSVTEVAFTLGFSDVGSFSRAFRRWTGKSPSEFSSAG